MVASVTEEIASKARDETPSAAATVGKLAWSPAWRTHGLLLLLGLAGLVGLHWQAAQEAVRVWASSQTFNHCFLIFPISAYLIWDRADRLKALQPVPCLWGLLPLALGSLAWLIANTANVLLVEQFALVFMGQSLVLTLLGWRVFRTLLFPLFVWYFAVPFGTELIPYLQHLTAEMVVPLLRLSGIPVFIEGIYLHIPSGSFEIAEACAGLRYLISCITLGFLAAHVLFDSTLRRVLFVIFAIATPIFANGVRAYGIMMIAHLSDYKLAVGVDHLIYGWFFFSVVTLCILGVGFLFRDKGAKPAEEAPATSIVASGGQWSVAMVFLAACLSGSLGMIYKGTLETGIAQAAVAPGQALRVAEPWMPTADGAPEWQPHYPKASLELKRGFGGPDEAQVELYAALYPYQRQGVEVIHAKNRPFGLVYGWQPFSTGWQVARIGDQDLEVWQTQMRTPQGERLFWYWYWVDHRFTANRYLAKLLEVKSKLLNRRGEAAFVALSTKLDVPLEQAVARMNDFLSHAEPIDETLKAILAGSTGG